MIHNNLKKIKFIEHAQFVHGSKYDYNKVVYKSSSKKVEIGCPKHGIFLQAPTPHLEGHGCPYCKYNRMTREEFIAQVIKLYGDKYDYSKCTYTHKKRTKDYITITCKIHGDFNKRVIQHLQGQGCEKCKMEEWKRTKLIVKPSSAIIDANSLKEFDIPMMFRVKMQFKHVNSHAIVNVWSEPFKSRTDAEELLDNMRMFLDMTNSISIEAIIIEMKQSILNSKTALDFILCLKGHMKSIVNGGMKLIQFLFKGIYRST